MVDAPRVRRELVDDGAALDTPGEMYVFDRLSRVLLPHSVAADYARQVGFMPRFQHLEPLAVQRDPLPIASAEGSSGGGEVQVVVATVALEM